MMLSLAQIKLPFVLLNLIDSWIFVDIVMHIYVYNTQRKKKHIYCPDSFKYFFQFIINWDHINCTLKRYRLRKGDQIWCFSGSCKDNLVRICSDGLIIRKWSTSNSPDMASARKKTLPTLTLRSSKHHFCWRTCSSWCILEHTTSQATFRGSGPENRANGGVPLRIEWCTPCLLIAALFTTTEGVSSPSVHCQINGFTKWGILI